MYLWCQCRLCVRVCLCMFYSHMCLQMCVRVCVCLYRDSLTRGYLNPWAPGFPYSQFLQQGLDEEQWEVHLCHHHGTPTPVPTCRLLGCVHTCPNMPLFHLMDCVNTYNLSQHASFLTMPTPVPTCLFFRLCACLSSLTSPAMLRSSPKATMDSPHRTWRNCCPRIHSGTRWCSSWQVLTTRLFLIPCLVDRRRHTHVHSHTHSHETSRSCIHTLPEHGGAVGGILIDPDSCTTYTHKPTQETVFVVVMGDVLTFTPAETVQQCAQSLADMCVLNGISLTCEKRRPE